MFRKRPSSKIINNSFLFVPILFWQNKYRSHKGTPEVILESLIVGTPVISSNFPQAKLLMNEDIDSLFFQDTRIKYLVDNCSLLSYLYDGRQSYRRIN